MLYIAEYSQNRLRNAITIKTDCVHKLIEYANLSLICFVLHFCLMLT